MWRYDAKRTAASPNCLPSQLELLWTVSYGQRSPVWDDPLNQDLMQYDNQFEPIVLEGRVFVGFNDQDKLVALEASSGRVLWTFFADAPFRLPPVGWRDRIFACSDDGFLYCLKAASGELIWSFRGGPNSLKALGNRRLTSAWPARGGPVIWKDRVYFAASIWPFMGTFIYELDAESGAVQWVNDNTGAQYIKQPHSAPSFAGVGPQGALVATDEYLIVPGGRSVPAVFRRSDGKFAHFEINAGGKGTGGSFVAADSVHFYVHTRGKGTRAFNIASGIKTAFIPSEPVILGDVLFSAGQKEGQEQIHAFQASLDDDKSREPLWTIDVPASDDLIGAGPHLVAAGQGKISVVQRPEAEGKGFNGGDLVRQFDIAQPVARLLVADKKLFVVTKTGSILAFGIPADNANPTASEPKQQLADDAVPRLDTVDSSLETERSASLVNRLLATGDPEGYAVWYGECSDELLKAWAAQSPFVQLAIVSQDAQWVDLARRQLDSLGVYGKITVHLSSPQDFRAPQYIANQVFVSPEVASQGNRDELASIYTTVRPYGGTLVLIGHSSNAKQLMELIHKLDLEEAEVSNQEELIIAKRAGALPGSADWTHQHGDIANTLKSNDSRARLPLGILWFGGSSNMDVLPRHGHGPPQQIVAGRLVIQGMNSLSARDVYTGRILWQREFENLGTFDVYYDATYEDTPLDPKYNQVHIPGANARGTNYVVTEDRVYLAIENRCKILNAATGKDIGEIVLPRDRDGSDPEWGFIGVYEDVLLGGVGFAKYRQRQNLEFESDKLLTGSKAGFSSKSLDRAASRALIGFDRHSGQMLWRVEATHSFWHNGIVAGGGKVYCLDRNPSLVEEALKRRGVANPETYRILAIDSKSGDTLWEVRDHIFGTWLGFSAQHNLLLQAGAKASDRLADEVGKGMRVYNAADGSLRWALDDLAYNGPCILHNNWIITNTNAYSISSGAYDIRTGQQRMIDNPITGQPQPWQITRSYGCNKIIASENMLTFRSGAAGYYDLLTDSGTGNWGGFKSGCTSNLIVAGGLLNAPDYTRTCSCSYQNQTSLALVHVPDLDQWTINLSATQAAKNQLVESVGINFGAPGDRRDADGTLWLEYPNVAGDDSPLTVQLNEGVEYHQQHSSQYSNAPLPWVVASSAVGVSELRIGIRTQEIVPQAVLAKGSDDGKNEASPVEFPGDGEASSPVERGQVSTLEQSTEYDIELFFGLPRLIADKQPTFFKVLLPEHNESANVVLSPTDEAAQTPTLPGDPQACTNVASYRFHNLPISKELVIMFEAQQGIPLISGIRLMRSSKGH